MTSCSSGSTPLTFRDQRLLVLLVQASLVRAAKSFLLRKPIISANQPTQQTMWMSSPRLHKQCGRGVRNFAIAVWEYEREKIVLADVIPSSLRPGHANSSFEIMRQTWKLALTTSYEALNRGPTIFPHNSRP